MSGTNWPAIRAEFPSLRGRTFLNTATFGQLADAHQRSGDGAISSGAIKPPRLIFSRGLTILKRRARLIGRLIHCTADDIAFVPNAGYALALAISSIAWKPGDEMLTLHHEFPNQLYGHAQRRRA